MPEYSFSWDLFNEVPIVGILRNISFENFKIVLPLAQKAGLTTLEITMNTPDVTSIINYARQEMSGVMNIGAGTVCNLSELDLALKAGAQFIVTPILDESVVSSAVALKIPIFPGCYTPSEIYKAWSLGALAVKLFPATTLGPAFIKDFNGPLNQIKLIPTGGVDLDNMLEFKKAGAVGYGIGSKLFDDKLIADNNWTELKNHIESFVKKIK